MKEALKLLLDFAIEETERGNDTFFSFSPHVKQGEIYSWGGKWSSEKDVRISKSLWVDDLTVENAQRVIEEFKILLAELNA